MSLRELETAVTELPSDDLSRFAQWFQEYFADAWDRQLELDVKKGRLNDLLNNVDQEFEAGRVTPL